MANYFWVGGTGTWSATGNTQFAITSGGIATLLNPTSADTVIFDANSGSGTITVAATAVSGGLTINKSDITLQLNGNVVLGSTAGIGLTTGILNLNGYAVSSFSFSTSNANARTIAFGTTGKIVLTGNNTTIWTAATTTNLSITGTSLVDCTYSGSTGTRTILSLGTITESLAINFKISAGSDTVVTGSGYTYRNLDFTGFTGTWTNVFNYIFGNLTIASGMTVTAGANVIEFKATSGTQQVTTNNKTLDFPITQNGVGGTVQLQDNLTMGATRTYTLTNGTLDLSSGNRVLSTGLFSSTNANTRVIAFGTGNITTTGSGTVWNTASTTGFSYTGTPTINISNNSATATTVSTGSMTQAQSLNFNYTVGTYTLTDTSAVYKSLNFTGFTGTIPNSARTIYGGATFVAGMTLTAGANATTFAATSGTNNITTAQTWDFPITVYGLGGTFAFQDALTMGSTRAFTFTAGTVQFKAGTTNTVGSFVATSGTTKYLQSTTAGTQAIISDASGINSTNNLTIQDSFATGGATWDAFYSNGNIDGGNNTNWEFGETPVLGNEYEYKLRSMTESRRF